MDYIFDLDGTLADCSHRLPYIKTKPKNWPAFHSREAMMRDTPISPMVEVCRRLAPHNNILFCTGRAGETREWTKLWITRTMGAGFSTEFPLYMRGIKDYRPDYVVKKELLGRMILDGFAPIMVFEDRPSVCDMWKEAGILVARVDDCEDF